MYIIQELELFSSPAARRLQDFVAAWMGKDGERSFQEFEEGLRQHLDDLGRVAMGGALGTLDVQCQEIEVAGVRYVKGQPSRETYYGLHGEVNVERNLYHRRDGGGDSVCPLELRAGIIEGSWTPKAAEVMTISAALMTPYEAESFLKKLSGGFTPSRSSLDRLPKALSAHWEVNRRNWEDAIRSQEEIPVATASAALSLDGVLVPMKDGERTEKRATAAAQGRQTRGPAGYREAACGTLSFYDKQGGRLGTLYQGRMPESKKVTLHEQLRDEVLSLGDVLPGFEELAFLADGAQDNWRIFDEIKAALRAAKINVPTVEIADFYHATEHLKRATDLRFGEGTPASSGAYEELRLILRDKAGGIDDVLSRLGSYRNSSRGKRQEELATELGYFQNNKDRMRYADYLNRNLPIGSGVTEAANKTLVTQRLKRSGMRWSIDGGQGILTFRALLRSERWEPAWTLISGSYRPKILLITEREAMQPLKVA